ncbi:hypothetical protein EVC28_026 [Rhizobium phage RHph_I1_23]|nr:hypothetical protein EVC28_026 [Rhizobium phage RHph_I1_23]
MSLFQYNSQQWLNTDSIETIDDYGYDIGVRLKSGREVRVPEHMREAFFKAIKGQTADEISMAANAGVFVEIVAGRPAVSIRCSDSSKLDELTALARKILAAID